MDRKPTVAILLADDNRTISLAAMLDGASARALVLQSTDEFYRTINQECVDLVIIENRLKGFLTGVEILERMHRDLLRPATLLVSEPSADVERRARKLGVDRIFPAKTPLHEVAGVASAVLTTAARDRVFVPPQARTLVQQVGAISPLPQLLVRLSSYLGRSEDEVIDDLAKDISVDARVTAELLKITNSSAMGRAYKTTNVFDAVRFLGVRRTVATVLSAGIFKAQTPMLRSVSPRLRAWYQYRSVLIGSTASSFASTLEDISAPTAYLLGLLQDIGILVLAHAFGDRYDQLTERVNRIGHLSRSHVELADFEVDHAQVSAALMQKWELPSSLVSMVLQHHDPETKSERPAVEQAFARVMRIGERVADIVDSRIPKRFLDLNDSLGYYGRGKAPYCKDALATAVARSIESGRLFSIPLPNREMINGLVADLTARCTTDGTPPSADAGGEAADAPPCAEQATSEEAPLSIDAEGERRSRILIVEDELAFVKLIRKWLDGLPIDVLMCSTAAEAVELHRDVDLIVCDIHLGKENGKDVIRRLNESGYLGNVIVISGDTRRQLVEDLIQMGVEDFLAKPFNRQLFVERVTRYLPKREVEEQAAGCLAGTS